MRKILFLVALTVSTQANALTFTDRASFESSLTNLILDDYENPAYVYSQPNVAMSGVRNETKYETTGHGFAQPNLVFGSGNRRYCGGCNGSFELDFATTSISENNGVDAVGLNYLNTGSNVVDPGPFQYTAFVQYTDGSVENFQLPLTPFAEVPLNFFGITSDKGIASIHFGMPNGVSTTRAYFAIDNLTIGQFVPEPSSLCLCVGSIALLGIRRR
jgi:hypothetical protein